MSYDFVIVDERRTDKFVDIILNRPEKHNAFNDQMIEELTSVFTSINKNYHDSSDIRLVRLYARGKSVCAGADLHYMSSIAQSGFDENLKDSTKLSNLFLSLWNVELPVLMKAHGACLGGGMGLLCSSDHVVAAKTSQYGFTETRLGLIPSVISPFCFAKLGVSQTQSLFLGADIFNAEFAKEIHLVHEVYSEDKLEEGFENATKKFLDRSSQAQRATKKLVRQYTEKTFGLNQETFQMTRELIAEQRASEDAQWGMSCLLEKKAPSWKER